MKTEQLCIALGVVSALSDEVYEPGDAVQCPSWNSLRETVFILSAEIERFANKEVRESGVFS